MHTLMSFTLVCVCMLASVTSEDVSAAAGQAGEDVGVGVDVATPVEDGKILRTAAQSDVGRRTDAGVGGGGGGGTAGGAGARDSQLLSLAARRRQLFSERLNQHIHVLAAIVHPSNSFRNATVLQPDYRNVSSVHTKRMLPAAEGVVRGDKMDSGTSKEVARSITDAKSSIAMKLFQDPRSRAGFLNNRRKESESTRIDTTTRATQDEGGLGEAVGGEERMNQDKMEGPEQEVVVDPDEEFQVDESSHGIYLLNFSDATNITDITKNKILTDNETKENILDKGEFAGKEVNISKEAEPIGERMVMNITTVDIKNISTVENFTNTIKTENLKESENKTQFMSDEIYNHFRPLESELRAEDMAQFLFFGQKLSTPFLSGENLTNSPSFSASTKSVNLIVPPTEKKKYTSRYSATEKNKFNNVGEDEVNEEMDVSVVKNVIEKNKIRNSVKGPAPARHISLLNAYRKPLNPAPLTRLPNDESNLTLINESRASNFTGREPILRSNYRNLSRGYLNTRRRPVRLTTVDSVSSSPPTNTTTEKSSTLVYTAVVTSVSITSSMKGQNKTESSKNLDLNAENINNATLSQLNSTITENETETTTLRSPSTFKSRHRIRLKTTTERISTEESVSSSTQFVFVNRRQPVSKLQDISKYVNESQASPFGFSPRSGFGVDMNKSSENDDIGTRLSLDGILTIDESGTNKSESPSTVWPPTGFIKTRRRSTTTTTSIPLTVSTSTAQSSQIQNAHDFNEPSGSTAEELENYSTPSVFTTISTEHTDLDANEGKTHDNERAPLEINPNENYTNSTLTASNGNEKTSENISIKPNEEVVIEAEKNYTASYVLAGLGFLPVTAIVVFVLRNILLKKTKELDTDYEGYFDEEPKKESPITPVARPAMPLPVKPDRKWEFPRNKLRLQTLLGQGNFGQVWKAEADDLSGHDGLTRLVAVKTIKDTATQKEKQELLHEICIMQKLGSHPNVVTLLACCTEQEPYLLVMEYVMCGKLLTYLRERRSRPDRFGGSGALTSRDLTVFAYCVARGMEYLASKGVVHRDLAARNVLVDHNKLCKIADFGMSREMSCAGESGEGGGGGGSRSQRHALPVRWMAPEALLYNVFNHETDVWAYGILLWEIVTLGSTPYAAMSGREVLQVVTEGYRLERPAHCKPALYRTMHACWHAAPAQRPAFVEIKAQLADLLDNEPSEGNYVDLDSFYQDSSVYSDPSAIVPDDADGDYAPPPPRNHVARASSAAEFDARFGFSAPPLRHHDFIGSPRMSGFGIRDCGFGERGFERTEGERESGGGGGQLGGRGSFSGGLQRLGSRSFQLLGDSGGGGGRNKRVPEFECDI